MMLRRNHHWLATAIVAVVGGLTSDCSAGPISDQPDQVLSVSPPPVQGALRLSLYGADNRGRSGAIQRTTYVRGRTATDMEDIEIDGAFDGANTPVEDRAGFTRVRVGRQAEGSFKGEQVNSRVLYRWSGVMLPPGATILSATLEVSIDGSGNPPTRLLLFDALDDRSNTEVDRENGTGGAGTSKSPLAHALLADGDDRIRFESQYLTRSIDRRLRAGKPLLFMLRLTGAQEDLPGSVVSLFAADYGDDRNPSRRPSLTLEWTSPYETSSRVVPVFLEYGRETVYGPFAVEGARMISVSFDENDETLTPYVEVRGGTQADTSKWQHATVPFENGWAWIEVRVQAVTDPVKLGDPVTLAFRDTRLQSTNSGRQAMMWTFRSPSGVVHQGQADRLGEDTWELSFIPDEVGPWEYWWTRHTGSEVTQSNHGAVDVVAGSRRNARRQLVALLSRIENESGRSDSLTHHYSVLFTRLERAALRFETPRSFRAAPGRELRETLNAIREALGGEPVPDSIPFKPSGWPWK